MTEPDSKKRSRLSSLLSSKLFRAAISVLLIGILLATLDLREIGSILSGVDPRLLAAGIFVFLLANMVSVFKWSLIVNAQGTRVSYFYLTSLFYIGLFFNNFLPTNFGGDVVKAFKLSRTTGRGAAAASSVVLDRASSVFALLLIALLPAIIKIQVLGTKLAIMIVMMFVAALVLIGFFASEKYARKLSGFRYLSADPLGIRKHLKSFYYSVHEFRGHRSTLFTVMLISLAYQGLQITMVYLLALSLGIDLSIIYYFLFIPAVLAVSMVPISLNGLGVREGAWVILFGQVGVTSAEAFTMSILTFLVMTLVSLAGGVFYLFDRAVPVRQEDEPEHTAL